MAAHRIVPENAEERLIFTALVWTWGFYVLGAMYLVGPLLAMSLVAIRAWRSFSNSWDLTVGRVPEIPAGVVVWTLGMLVMLLALLAGHISWDLGFAQTLKSSMGWVKGWALLAMFPFAGACLRIRPQLVARAASWFCLQTLILIPILILAGIVHLPNKVYISPLEIIGGPGPEFFTVYLYTIDPSNNALRWQFIAPWSPAAGMLGNMLFVLAFFERNMRFRVIGVITAVMMCLMTRSRMAQLFLVIYPPVIWSLSRLSKPWLLGAGALLTVVGSLLADTLLDLVQSAVTGFRTARMDSTRVREALGRIALQRWWEDAPIWGHGVVERGRHIVEHMPIGSHHTWFGLLYVKGAVGMMALFVPLLWTVVDLLILAQVTRIGRLGLTMTLLLIFYSWGENLEILAYLIWPALLLIGCAFKRGNAISFTATLPAAAPAIPVATPGFHMIDGTQRASEPG